MKFYQLIKSLRFVSIKQKIVYSVLVIIFFMFSILVLFIISMNSINNYVNFIINRGTQEAMLVRRMMEQVSLTQLNILGYIYQPRQAREFYTKNALIELKRNLLDVRETFLPNSEKSSLLNELIQYQQVNLDIFNSIRSGVPNEETERLHTLFHQNTQAINRTLKDINDRINMELVVGSGIVTNKVRNARFTMVIFILIVICIEALVAYLLIKGIIPNIKQLVAKSRIISEGDLSQRVEIDTGDELGLLAANFNRMIESLDIAQKDLKQKNYELKMTQKKVVGQAKLALLGQMTAGVAHEIKNPLNAMKGAVEYLLIKSKNQDLFQEYLHLIKDEILRLNKIVDEFMSLARQKSPEKVSVDIRSIFSKIERMIQLKCRKKKIFLNISISPDASYLTVDPDQINQVLLNIIINAVDAIEESGEINIFTSREIRVEDSVEQPYLVITLKDNGPGIPENIREKIFSPFFTTKTKGIGLGLSLSNELIIQHDGFIELASEKGRGSCFKIFLPVE